MDPRDTNSLPLPTGNPQQLPPQPAPSQHGPSEPESQPYASPAPPQPPQPSYTQPFRPTPPQPTYPYQPLSPNPGVNPYYDHPQLPNVATDRPQQPPQPAPMPTPPPRPPQSKDGHSRRFKVIVTLVVLGMLAIAGGLTYLFVSQLNDKEPEKRPAASQPAEKEEEPKEETPSPEPEPQPTTTALDTFTRTTFVPPANIPAEYQPFDYKVGGVSAYVTAGRKCELQFGLLGADRLPGNDALDVVKRQIDALRAAGNSVSDPEKTDDLKLRHTDNENNFYTMSDYVFTADMKSGRKVRSHYAVAVLKDGTRAYVLRTCNDTNPVPAETLAATEQLAQAITLRPQQ